MTGTETLEIPGYQVVQFLGSGARSTIWQVRDCQTRQVYALKRVVKRHSEDARFLEQAIQEYDVGSRMDHPALRRAYALHKVKRWLGLREVRVLLEYCEGQTVQKARPQSVSEAVRIFGHVASGLAHMNARGFVHADTKPNNIIVAPDGAVKLIDFGQSCPVGMAKLRIQGTPDFIAPEQVLRRPVDARTDVFNLGAALYWTLTGRPIPTVLPKEGSLTPKGGQKVTPVGQLNPDVPPPLAQLVAECIELSPAQRPASMNEVQSRLSLIARQMERGEAGTP